MSRYYEYDYDDYYYDAEYPVQQFWDRAVANAMNGKRGQAFLRELVEALDAMPVKELIPSDLENEEGQVCALGAVGHKRKLDLGQIYPNDHKEVGEAFGIAHSMAYNIAAENDTCGPEGETPAERWRRMRDWAASLIRETNHHEATS